MRSLIMMAIMFFISECFAAEAIAIRAAGSVLSSTDGETFAVATPMSEQSSVPDDMPDPEYWIDASDTASLNRAYEEWERTPGHDGRWHDGFHLVRLANWPNDALGAEDAISR